MRPRPILPLLLLAAVAAPELSAQAERYNKHNFTVGLGAAQPRGELRNLFHNSFATNIGYLYRFSRYFGVETGFDLAFGAARIEDYYPTDIFGDLRIRDYQFMVPFGGRAILPLANERLQISGGVGGAYLAYTERIGQPSDYVRIDCPVCATRTGWGYYGSFGVSVGLDRRNTFRLGVNSRVVRGHTEGDPLGPVPPNRTRDNWVNILGTFTVSF